MLGLVRRDSLSAGILLAAILTCGLMMLWLVVLGFITIVAMNFQPRNATKELDFTQEGEPLIDVTTPVGDTWSHAYFTLDGKPISQPSLSRSHKFAPHIPSPDARFRFHRDWQMRISGFLQPGEDTTYWYLVDPETELHRPYFIGFDARSKQCVGYLGREGFVPDPPAIEDRFKITPMLFYEGGWAPQDHRYGEVPTSPMPRIKIASGGELLAVDMERRLVEPVPTPDKVLGVASYEQQRLVGEQQDVVSQRHFAVRLPGQLRLMTVDNAPLLDLSMPPQKEDMTLSLNQFPNGLIVVKGYRAAEPGRNYLFTYNADGELVRQQTADLGNPREPESAWTPWVMMLVSIPQPAVQLALSLAAANDRVQSEQATNLMGAYRSLISDYWLPFATLVLISLVAAVYPYRRQQRYAPRQALAWGVFVLLLGVPGLLGYLLHRRWPHRAQCEHCGRVVPRDRRQCLDCQVDFAPPALKGIEIFA
jgi:hypothetical protein